MFDVPDRDQKTDGDPNDNYPAEVDLDWDTTKHGSMADYAEEG